MSKNRVIVSSVVLEGRSPSAVAADYGVQRRWVHTLVKRYREGGWDAIEPRSRRPHTSPTQLSQALEGEIVALRIELASQGHDAGAETIAAHLHQRHNHTPSTSAIWRVLRRHQLVTPQPKKRPRSSYTRFEADLPNETWQSDFTHWRLSCGAGVEVLTWLDDHSRLALSITAQPVVTGLTVLTDFRANIEEYGPPASTLTDNGLVFTTRSRNGRNKFENELRLLNITQKNGRPNHPQTQGKVERFQQTLKKWLAAQPPADTVEELQTQLDRFRNYYNQIRPHRSLNRKTPAQAYTARTKVGPAGTVRYHSRLHHIGIGRPHKGTPVKLLIHNDHIRIINANTGELLRQLIIDPTRDYQPQQTQNALPKESEM